MTSNLDELLGRADKLNTSLSAGRAFSTNQETGVWTAAPAAGKPQPAAQPSTSAAPAPTGLNQGTAPAATTASDRKIAEAAAKDPVLKEMQESSTLEGFLAKRRQNILTQMIQDSIQSSMEDVKKRHYDRIASDWSHQKRRLMDTMPGVDVSQATRKAPAKTFLGGPSARLDELQRGFAIQLSGFTTDEVGGVSVDSLVKRFATVVKSMQDLETSNIWEQVAATIDATQDNHSDDVIVRKSINFLENAYLRHVEDTVFGNLGQAERGGRPGLEETVIGYLNVNLQGGYAGAENGAKSGHPIWAIVFTCLRMGKVGLALKFCQGQGPDLADFAAALADLDRNGRLSSDMKTKLKLHYRRTVRASTDRFKRLVYSVLATCDTGNDHGDVIDTIENWLWVKLHHAKNCEHDGQPDSLSLNDVRLLITKQYGEAHFARIGSPVVYFTALWLTGQRELAIEFLQRQGASYATHAVHVAMATYKDDALTCSDGNAKLCSPVDNSGIEFQLNVAKLVLQYTSGFSHTDPDYAILYFYFLRDFKTERGENLFLAAVSDLVLQTKEFEKILGSVLPDGTRKPCLMDNFSLPRDELRSVIEHTADVAYSKGMVLSAVKLYDLCEVRCDSVIEHTADVAYSKGMVLSAVKLYDLCENGRKAMEHLSQLLAQYMTLPVQPHSTRDQVAAYAWTLHQRLPAVVQGEVGQTFDMLMSLLHFFDLFHAQKTEEALKHLKDVNILPASTTEVGSKLATFVSIPELVRRVLPELLLATMKLLKQSSDSVGQQAGSDTTTGQIRDAAHAVLQFASRIPYQLGSTVTAELIRLESNI